MIPAVAAAAAQMSMYASRKKYYFDLEKGFELSRSRVRFQSRFLKLVTKVIWANERVVLLVL